MWTIFGEGSGMKKGKIKQLIYPVINIVVVNKTKKNKNTKKNDKTKNTTANQVLSVFKVANFNFTFLYSFNLIVIERFN